MKFSSHIVLLCLAAYILGHRLVAAQNPQVIDSLKQQLRAAPHDSTRIRHYANLTWEYAITRSKLDTAQMYADSIRYLASINKDREAENLAAFYYGVIKRFKGEFSEGLKHLDRYVAFHKKKGDTLKMTAGLFQIATIQNNMGDWSASLTNYLRILKIYRSLNMDESTATTLHSIGHIQRKLGKPREALKTYMESIGINEKINNITGLSMNYESLGNTYREIGQYDNAEIHLQRALDYARDENRDYGIASVTENLGNLFEDKGNFQKALNYHLDALNIRNGLPSKKDRALSLNKVGSTYLKLQNTTKAEPYLAKSLALAETIDAKTILLNNYEALMALNERKGNYKRAYEYQRRYMATKDSILNAQTLKQLHELETRYETEQKDHKIELLNRDKELQETKNRRQVLIRNFLIGIFLLSSLIAWLIINSLRQRLKNQKLIAAKNEEIKLTELREELSTLELKALRAQMNPHFLFNCMNSINRMILSSDNENASRYLAKFSKLVRLMLENSENPKVSLKEELEMLEAYIEMESLRLKGRIICDISVDESVDQEATLIPSMILQPFVENAIWHGLSHLEKDGRLLIEVLEKDRFLHCHIIDNGIGREASLKLQSHYHVKKKPMGIKITEKRLHLLSKSKMVNLITIKDLKNKNRALGTQVDILIPI